MNAQPRAVLAFCITFMIASSATAHDPIFALGPHVLYKGGVEASWVTERADSGAPWRQAVEAAYGLTGDWAVTAQLTATGPANAPRWIVASKYRFWRRDRLGIQESMALMLRGEDQGGWGTGIAYGFESIRWYRWLSARRLQGPETNGRRPAPQWRLDLVGGIRPKPPRYTAPDAVWLLELNGEFSEAGGQRWFLSPGLFWTWRNFAIKTGVQQAVQQGGLPKVERRLQTDIEWHF